MVEARAPSCEDSAEHLRHVIRSWDHTKTDGLVSERELHQALVLLGLDPSAGAVQELFDEIDEEGTYRVSTQDLTDFVLHRDDSRPFRKHTSSFVF